jgi:hypothetical protein
VTELSLHLPSLDEVFLTLTGRRADAAPTDPTDPTDPTNPTNTEEVAA